MRAGWGTPYCGGRADRLHPTRRDETAKDGAPGLFGPIKENGKGGVLGAGRGSGAGCDWSFVPLLLCSCGPEAGIDIGEDAVAAFDFGEAVFLGFGECAG